jgi:glutamyl-tRNA reductase
MELIGALHLDAEKKPEQLAEWKKVLELDGLVYLSTCNRVEFIFSDETYFCTGRMHRLLQAFQIDWNQLGQFTSSVKTYRGEEAMTHLLRVACGLESMVLGEREIITQLREAFDCSTSLRIAGDQLRITGRLLIETAKRIFTETAIGAKPVSVNSLGWHCMKEWKLPLEAPILMIGAGQTNRNVARFMTDSGYQNVTILNRTFETAKKLAAECNWNCEPLDTLPTHLKNGPKAIVICTSSLEPILDAQEARHLPAGPLYILDLGLPADTSAAFRMREETTLVDLNVLHQKIDANLAVRKAAIDGCEIHIQKALSQYRDRLQQRQVELAMRDLPSTISAIRETALGEIFAQDLSRLDEDTRELIDRIVQYMEKKICRRSHEVSAPSGSRPTASVVDFNSDPFCHG